MVGTGGQAMEGSKTGIVVGVLCACLGSQAAYADVTSSDEYMQRLKIAQTIDPHGPTPFGEQVNPYTGDLTFTQDDVTLEGIGPTWSATMFPNGSGSIAQPPYPMGDWMLSILRIETLTHADWHVVVGICPVPTGSETPAHYLLKHESFGQRRNEVCGSCGAFRQVTRDSLCTGRGHRGIFAKGG